MDINNNVIIYNGDDITDRLASCVFDAQLGKYQVRYNGGNKVYFFNRENLMWYQNPSYILPNSVALYIGGRLQADIKEILDFGVYVRLIFLYGAPKLYRKEEISFDDPLPKAPNAQAVLAYLKQVSSVVSLKDKNDNSFLSREYEKMDIIHKDSVFTSYLSHEVPKTRTGFSDCLIYPFGFNLSQKSAVKRSFSSSVSIIEGPPGTGKTQTILNIIANAVLNDKTVAVVSNNNYATLNVYEKLLKYDLGFICAYLGRKDNRERFFDEIQRQPLPNIQGWARENSAGLMGPLVHAHQKLDDMLADQNTLALLKQLLDALQVEKHYFDEYYVETQADISVDKDFRLKRADHYLSLLFEYQRLKSSGRRIGLLRKIYQLFVYGMRQFSFYDQPSEKVISYLQKKYYEEKIKELEHEIQELSKKLEHYHFDAEMKAYSENSMKVFKAYLAGKYGRDKARETFTNKNFRARFGRFIDQYPVILSTTHSLRNCAQNGFLFDYVIIDEASQVDLASGGIALSCAKNVVVVGDLKQLPNIVERKYLESIHELWRQFQIDEAYHYANNSLLTSTHKVFQVAPKTLLREHYRCHPKIIGFCNHKFYRGQLITLTKEMDVKNPLIAYKTVKGNHARGRYNQRQIDVVFEEVLPEQHLLDKGKSIAVISPYRPQADALIKEIEHRGYGRQMDANTVHKFQGMEKDVIIFTTVANEINDFIDDPSLINVAVSRAIEQMIIVAADYNNEGNLTNIGDLIKYINYNNFDVVESKIYSVFDLLYKQYSEELLTFLKKGRKVSEYNSENLMEPIIQKVLEEQDFQGLDRVLHQPLRMLIRDTQLLTTEEYHFVMNPWTHTDFLIFNRIDKSPVLVVEVDGYQFHAGDPTQLARDKMKDEILRKYGIPILRFSTNGSEEERKLREKLLEITVGIANEKWG